MTGIEGAVPQGLGSKHFRLLADGIAVHAISAGCEYFRTDPRLSCWIRSVPENCRIRRFIIGSTLLTSSSRRQSRQLSPVRLSMSIHSATSILASFSDLTRSGSMHPSSRNFRSRSRSGCSSARKCSICSTRPTSATDREHCLHAMRPGTLNCPVPRQFGGTRSTTGQITAMSTNWNQREIQFALKLLF